MKALRYAPPSHLVTASLGRRHVRMTTQLHESKLSQLCAYSLCFHAKNIPPFITEVFRGEARTGEGMPGYYEKVVTENQKEYKILLSYTVIILVTCVLGMASL